MKVTAPMKQLTAGALKIGKAIPKRAHVLMKAYGYGGGSIIYSALGVGLLSNDLPYSFFLTDKFDYAIFLDGCFIKHLEFVEWKLSLWYQAAMRAIIFALTRLMTPTGKTA